MPSHFLSASSLAAQGPFGFPLSIERALWHLGFVDVRVIDGSGDKGGDILAVRGREQWVFQCKWKKSGAVDRSAIDEVDLARAQYAADMAVVVTNTRLTPSAKERIRELERVGIRTYVWDAIVLTTLWERMPRAVPNSPTLRDYQTDAVDALTQGLLIKNRALLVLATGLGKTVVGGEVIARTLRENPSARILVVAHMKELVNQLERAFWRQLDKHTATRALHSDKAFPDSFDGLTVATVDAALRLVEVSGVPDLIMMDEAHHLGESGKFSELLDITAEAPQFGVTATPWRGDKFDITERYGAPSFSMGIEEGMSRGYLSQVDYRILVDNVNWDFVRAMSENDYSIKELNRKLFLPQRDQQIIDQLREAWSQISNPRAILFCQTIEHAERIAAALRKADPAWANAVYLHSGLSRQKRQILLNAFRLGRSPIITCVDVFNEGVDVPDVNLIGFLRVTHSRRIFVQQLGRGLRLSAGKTQLRVLDFVTDIRRVAAALEMKRAMDAIEVEEVSVLDKSMIEFSDQTAGKFLDYWIADAASLETAADEVRLNFPAGYGIE